MRKFECIDAKSSKFWEVGVHGKTLHVTFGKIESGGQSKAKEFPTTEKAIAEMEKLIREKTVKGYVEVRMTKGHENHKYNVNHEESLLKKEAAQKAKKLVLMFKNETAELAIQMLLACEDERIHEALLEGSSIDNVFGRLVPGPILKKAGRGSELFGIIALVYFPGNMKPPKGLNKKKSKYGTIKKNI